MSLSSFIHFEYISRNNEKIARLLFVVISFISSCVIQRGVYFRKYWPHECFPITHVKVAQESTSSLVTQ